MKVLHVKGQGVGRGGIAVGDNEAALDDVAEFTDIPFPRVLLQDTDIIRRDHADSLPHFGR